MIDHDQPGHDGIAELDGRRAIFIGFKLDTGLRRQLESLTGPDRKYVSTEDSTFLRICRVGEDHYVGKLIDERRKEIDRRVKEMEKEVGAVQMKLFDEVEKDQYQRDLSWLRGRREQLVSERETEPEAVKSRYALRGKTRAFPLAVLYLLPENLVKGGH